MPVLKTDHLLLVVTGESKANNSALQFAKKHNILLLKKQQKLKYFNDIDFCDKFIFVTTNKPKESDASSKPKQRITGQIKITSSCYELDWDILGCGAYDQTYKNYFNFFCEVTWVKKLQISKSKLPSYFSDLFGKKQGYHSIKLLQGYKLRDILQYPASMMQKIFADIKNNEYILSQQSSNSDSSDGQSDSDSDSDSDTDSQDSSEESRQINKKKKNKERSRQKKKSAREKSRKRSNSRTDKRKKEKRQKQQKRNKNRSKEKKREKQKTRQKKKSDKSKKDRSRQKQRQKDKQKQKNRNKQKQKHNNKEKERDRQKDRQKSYNEKKKSQKQKQKTKYIQKQAPVEIVQALGKIQIEKLQPPKQQNKKQKIKNQQPKDIVRNHPLNQVLQSEVQKRRKLNNDQPNNQQLNEQLDNQLPKKKKGLFQRLGAQQQIPKPT